MGQSWKHHLEGVLRQEESVELNKMQTGRQEQRGGSDICEAKGSRTVKLI